MGARFLHGFCTVGVKAIAVEDSPTGIASAKAAGLKVLALKPRHGEPLDQSAADCIITRLMDVAEHLD